MPVTAKSASLSHFIGRREAETFSKASTKDTPAIICSCRSVTASVAPTFSGSWYLLSFLLGM